MRRARAVIWIVEKSRRRPVIRRRLVVFVFVVALAVVVTAWFVASVLGVVVWFVVEVI